MRILNILTPKRLRGNFGERAAAKLLRREGYRILERNFVTDAGEIDIIAKKANTVAIVEVKTRSVPTLRDGERPALAVTREKMQRLLRAGAIYNRLRRVGGRLRFDVIEVYTEGEGRRERVVKTHHIEGAFDGSAMRGTRK